MAQPFHSLCSKIFDEHPTVATPKEQKFCAVTSQIHSGRALDTTAQIPEHGGSQVRTAER